ncbi:MAG TPA: hypothetical protein VFP44_13840 [Usitatibacter sp.]|nr:hypothetical protein [Usitatibacter sp.]
MQRKYANDVVWLTVNSTSTASRDHVEPAQVASRLKEFNAAPARYLMDDPGTVGRAYGAKTTPHMFIVDSKGTVVYNGATPGVRPRVRWSGAS